MPRWWLTSQVSPCPTNPTPGPTLRDGSLLIVPVPGYTFCDTGDNTFRRRVTTSGHNQEFEKEGGIGLPSSPSSTSCIVTTRRDGGDPRGRVPSRLDDGRALEPTQTPPNPGTNPPGWVTLHRPLSWVHLLSDRRKRILSTRHDPRLNQELVK